MKGDDWTCLGTRRAEIVMLPEDARFGYKRLNLQPGSHINFCVKSMRCELCRLKASNRIPGINCPQGLELQWIIRYIWTFCWRPSAKLTGSRKPVVEHLKHKYYAKPLRSSPSRGCHRGCRTAVAVPKSVVSTSFAMYPDFLSLSSSAPSN